MPPNSSHPQNSLNRQPFHPEKADDLQPEQKRCDKCLYIDELHLLKERLHKAVQLADIGYFEANLKTGEVQWDTNSYDIHGIPQGDPMTYSRFVQEVVHPDDIQLCMDRFNKMVTENRPFFMEYRSLTSKGEVRWIREKVEPHCDSSGRVIYLYGAKRNITEERENQEKIHEYQQLLEEKNRLLEELATHDELTKIYNRRMFNERFEAEWRRAQRLGRSLTIAIADIDHFKEFNDLYGHLSGDICLSTVADILAQTITRSTDMVARYGGEEFAFILPDTSEPEMLIEQCRKNVADLRMSHQENGGGIVTISIGAATAIPTRNSKKTDILRLADEMLYTAKANGRNQIIHTFKK